MTTAIISVVVVLLLIAALRLWLTANRLDRLHVRTEAAWAALEGALARRIVVARALAAVGGIGDERAALLRGLARRADTAARADRAAAENALSRAIAALPDTDSPDLRGELSDAEERLVLARRFYNDAVRDTRALREAWFTRFWRLAGSAAMPQYFALTEYPERYVLERQERDRPTPPAVAAESVVAAATIAPDSMSAAVTTDPVTMDPVATDPVATAAGLQPRLSGRVVLLDGRSRVLLLHGRDPGRPQDGGFWFTPGGGLEAGEDVIGCAVRELREETGLDVAAADLTGPIWERRAEFEFMGEWLTSEEYFYGLVLTVDDVVVDIAGFTPLERDTVDEYRWWTRAELTGSDERIYPVELADRLDEVIDAVARRGSVQAVQID